MMIKVNDTVKVKAGVTDKKKNGVLHGTVRVKTWNPDWGDDIDGLEGKVVRVHNTGSAAAPPVYEVDFDLGVNVGLLQNEIELV